MFTYIRLIRMADSDATSGPYFTSLQMIALEAFEAYLSSAGFHLGSQLEEGPFSYPIVRSEADYASLSKVGDLLEVQLSLEQVGTTSFCLASKILQVESKVVVASVKITHVTILKKTKMKEKIPEVMLGLLEKLRAK